MQVFQQLLLVYIIVMAGMCWYKQKQIVQVFSDQYNAHRWWYSVGDEIVVFGFTKEIDGEEMVSLNESRGFVVFLPTDKQNLNVQLADGHMYSVKKAHVKRATKKSCGHGCNHRH